MLFLHVLLIAINGEDMTSLHWRELHADFFEGRGCGDAHVEVTFDLGHGVGQTQRKGIGGVGIGGWSSFSENDMSGG